MNDQAPKKPDDDNKNNDLLNNMIAQARSMMRDAVATFKSNVRLGVHESVQSANKMLEFAEKQTNELRKPVSHGLKRVQQQVVPYWTEKAVRIYEQRLDYGPQLVTGSAVLVGGYKALRRGNGASMLPAAFYATFAGSLAYMIIYEPPVPPLEDWADWIFGEKK
jgi:hypothetical protein